MKYTTILSFAALAVASPQQPADENEAAILLYNTGTGVIAKEFTQGGCKDNIFIFSRGSAEVGNM